MSQLPDRVPPRSRKLMGEGVGQPGRILLLYILTRGKEERSAFATTVLSRLVVVEVLAISFRQRYGGTPYTYIGTSLTLGIDWTFIVFEIFAPPGILIV